jgi:cyclic pyranopterin phosphate synthase
MPCEEEVDWVRRDDLLSFEEIERVVTTLVNAGIRKVRITGGEPFARAGVTNLLRRLKGIDRLESLAITTNGVLLADRLPELRGVIDAYNISLDTFSRERFMELTGRDRLADVMRGINGVLAEGYRNLKVNCVVMRGINDDEVEEFARFAAAHPIAVRFIEFMPFAGNAWSEGRIVPMDEILASAARRWSLERIPDGPSPISRDFRLRDRETGVSGKGTIGVIASMSTPFCSTCSRLRLTAEGKIMPCLHSPLEFDLRKVLRSGGSDAEILSFVGRALAKKPEEHPPASEMATPSGRVMIQIGG